MEPATYPSRPLRGLAAAGIAANDSVLSQRFGRDQYLVEFNGTELDEVIAVLRDRPACRRTLAQLKLTAELAAIRAEA